MGRIQIPSKQTSRDAVLQQMRALSTDDADWHGGKTWSLVYFADDELLDLLKEAYAMFFCANGLSPMAFPSLRQFEHEVVAMTADLLRGGPDAVGTMTTGGTESILLAVKTARDKMMSERPGIAEPEMVLPITAHPAFEKAAHYLRVKPVHYGLDARLRADPNQAESLLTPNTVLLVGSAPGYPYGVVDPIADLAALAARHEIPCHVDACLGGFLLPWLRRLGREIPDFDFSVPGVTSISADLHKYGFAARGASTITYRDERFRRHQFFAYTEWPGGLYASPSMTGSRAGGAIAAAWAALHFLGEEGYLKLAQRIMATTERLQSGIRSIGGLSILGEPDMSVFAFTAESLDVFALGEQMQTRGWRLDAQHRPPSLHMMVVPSHERVVEPFLTDLAAAVRTVREAPEAARSGMAAIYGMAGANGGTAPVRDLLIELLGQAWPAAGE